MAGTYGNRDRVREWEQVGEVISHRPTLIAARNELEREGSPSSARDCAQRIGEWLSGWRCPSPKTLAEIDEIDAAQRAKGYVGP